MSHLEKARAVNSEATNDDVAGMGTNQGRSGPDMVRVGSEASFQEQCSSSRLRIGPRLPSRGTGQLNFFAGGEGRSSIPGSAIGQIAVPVVAPVVAPIVAPVVAPEDPAPVVPVPIPVVAPVVPALVIEENPDINIDGGNFGPNIVSMGNAETFRELCNHARLTAGPGDPAPVVEERGGGGHPRPGRNLGPFIFLLIISFMLAGARSQEDVDEGFLVKTTAFLVGSEIPSEFTEKPFNFRDNLTTGAKYRNLTVDAGTRAMTVASHEQSEREVDADEVYIKMCLKGLLGHLKSGLGTPLRKDGEGKSNIDELFDRDTKQGSDSRRNWGMFYPNITQKYAINFSGSARIGGSGRGFLKMVVVGGLVLATSAVLLLQ